MLQHIDQVYGLLSKTGLQRKPGNIIYSGYETLSLGDYYFLGMNPGRHVDDKNPKEDQIISKLIKKKNIPRKTSTLTVSGAMKRSLVSIVIKKILKVFLNVLK